MKIGILQTGSTSAKMIDKHGDYDDLFKHLLADRGFEFSTYRVIDNQFPNAINAADGWLITGSEHGVYEPHPWISPLESFVRQAFEAHRPLVGVCFGHQLVAQALGGNVAKFEGGWSVGAIDYQMIDDQATKAPYRSTIMAWHQDQIIELPEHANVIASNEFCRYAMLNYNNRVLTIQAHPEFCADYMASLLDEYGDTLPEAIRYNALNNLDAPLSSTRIADQFEHFFKFPRNT